MPSITLPHGTVDSRVAGPSDAAGPPVVFVHGALVDATLWTRVADGLAAAGVRSHAPDWPLGSHRRPLAEHAEHGPRAVARQIVAFLEALDLRDVTLVGNDTGGALCQFVLDTDPSRVGRVVLTNCDAFSTFPPQPFSAMFRLMRSRTILRLGMAPMRLRAFRHSALGFGALARELDAEQTLGWIRPALTDPGVRRDFSAFAARIDPAELDVVSRRLSSFDGPALLVWGTADRFFTPDLAERLAATFSDAHLVRIDGARTFVPLDAPERLVEEILTAFPSAGVPAASGGAAPAG